jgi:hypothetical protein
VVWAIEGIPLLAGEQSLHACDIRHCVNYLDHLFKGSQADNMKDAGAKGHMRRDVRGERNPRARLSSDAVALIRSVRPKRYAKNSGLVANLAATYSVSTHLIRLVWYDESLWGG